MQLKKTYKHANTTEQELKDINIRTASHYKHVDINITNRASWRERTRFTLLNSIQIM